MGEFKSHFFFKCTVPHGIPICKIFPWFSFGVPRDEEKAQVPYKILKLCFQNDLCGRTDC